MSEVTKNTIDGQSYFAFAEIVKQKLSYENAHNLQVILEYLEKYIYKNKRRNEASRFVIIRLIEKADAYDQIRSLLK